MSTPPRSLDITLEEIVSKAREMGMIGPKAIALYVSNFVEGRLDTDGDDGPVPEVAEEMQADDDMVTEMITEGDAAAALDRACRVCGIGLGGEHTSKCVEIDGWSGTVRPWHLDQRSTYFHPGSSLGITPGLQPWPRASGRTVAMIDIALDHVEKAGGTINMPCAQGAVENMIDRVLRRATERGLLVEVRRTARIVTISPPAVPISALSPVAINIMVERILAFAQAHSFKRAGLRLMDLPDDEHLRSWAEAVVGAAHGDPKFDVIAGRTELTAGEIDAITSTNPKTSEKRFGADPGLAAEIRAFVELLRVEHRLHPGQHLSEHMMGLLNRAADTLDPDSQVAVERVPAYALKAPWGQDCAGVIWDPAIDHGAIDREIEEKLLKGGWARQPGRNHIGSVWFDHDAGAFREMVEQGSRHVATVTAPTLDELKLAMTREFGDR